MEKPDSAILYYKKAIELAEKIKNKRLGQITNGELSAYYTQLGAYEEAYKSMNIAFQNKAIKNKATIHSTAARYYFQTNQIDSAMYYYNLLLNNNNGYSYKAEGYKGLSCIAQNRHEYKESLDLLRKYLIYNDSAEKVIQNENVRKINALYNYQQIENKNKRLEIEKQHQKIYALIYASCTSILLLLFIAYRQYKKRKEKEKSVQQEKIYRILENRYKQSIEYIHENEKKIEELNKILKESEISKNILQQELLLAQKKALEKINEQIEASKQAEQKATIALKKSPIYYKLSQLHDKPASDKDWTDLKNTIAETFPTFVQQLKELYPMSEIETHICLLLKIKMPLKQIPCIVARSKQSITSIRKRLFYKIFKKEGTPEEWDNFIENL